MVQVAGFIGCSHGQYFGSRVAGTVRFASSSLLCTSVSSYRGSADVRMCGVSRIIVTVFHHDICETTHKTIELMGIQTQSTKYIIASSQFLMLSKSCQCNCEEFQFSCRLQPGSQPGPSRLEFLRLVPG